MNNSLDRLIDGMIATLRDQVIPQVKEDFSRGQAYGVIDLLNNLKLRIDWAVLPLRARIAMQQALIAEVELVSADMSPRPPSMAPCADLSLASGSILLAEADRLDAHISMLLDWLADHRSSLPATRITALEALLMSYMDAAVRQDMDLTARPLFGEIVKG